MSTYGFGVIGCGVISDTHIKAIKELEESGLRPMLIRAVEIATL